MRRRLPYLIIFLWMVAFSAVQAASDTTVVHDLSHDWYFYDNSSESYLPLISKGKFREKTIHFDVNGDNYLNTLLRVKSNNELSLFLNNKMIDLIKGTHYYKIDSLVALAGSKEMHFTIYNKDIQPLATMVELLTIQDSVEEPLSNNAVVVRPRDFSPFRDFVIASLVLLMGFMAALYNYFPRVFSDFFRISKAFSLRESDENLYKTRPLNQVNLLMYLFVSLMISFILIFIVNQAGLFLESGIFYVDSFKDGLWKWIKLGLIIQGWFFVKYILINNLSSLFHLGGFMVSHYYNYIRMTLIIFITALSVMIFTFFSLEIISEDFYYTILKIILAFMGFRVVILFFKLLTSASYKTLHLFSYLCGTEVIPYVILLYLGLNQPF